MDTTSETVSHTENNTQDSAIFERAPWYVVFCRIVMVLFFTSIIFAFFASIVAFAINLFIPISTVLTWAENHMVAAIIILVAAFVFFTIWLMAQAGQAIGKGAKRS